MKAAVLHEVNTPLVIEDVPVSKPKSREVLVRTAACGVCHSDLHYIEGKYAAPLPTVLGHEAAGVVEAGRFRGAPFQARRPRDFLPQRLLRPL